MHRVAMAAAAAGDGGDGRGRTLGAVIKEKDEELALFLEMRRREKERGAAAAAAAAEQLLLSGDRVDVARDGMLLVDQPPPRPQPPAGERAPRGTGCCRSFAFLFCSCVGRNPSLPVSGVLGGDVCGRAQGGGVQDDRRVQESARRRRRLPQFGRRRQERLRLVRLLLISNYYKFWIPLLSGRFCGVLVVRVTHALVRERLLWS